MHTEWETETWQSKNMRVGKAFVSFDYLEDNYIWIYYLQSNSKRDLHKLLHIFLERYCGIIEFRTLKPELFKNHLEFQGNEIYRFKR